MDSPDKPGRRRRLPLPRRRWSWIGVAASALLLAAVVGLVSAYRAARIPESGSRQTLLFFTRETDLTTGSRLDPDDLAARLTRLGYEEASDSLAPGRYARVGDGFRIHLRGFRYPTHRSRPGRLEVRIHGGTITASEPIDPLSIDDRKLEPERIAGYEGSIGSFLDPISLAEAPPLLVRTVLAIEDRRFAHHPGIDPIGTARALWRDLLEGERAQGGSTITQQLARSLFLHNRKTFARKLQEAFLAVGLELRYSKDEILEAYLNAIYWGYWGTMEIRGVREASRYYLGCEIEEADAAGIALLVGLIRAPNLYSPYSSTDRARRRRDLVLRVLEDRGLLSPEEAREALDTPLPTKRPPDRIAEASYFLDAARREILRRSPPGTLAREGVQVFTTLDPRDQAAVVSELRSGLERLERQHRRLRGKDRPVQGAVVVIDPHQGEVRALVGGRDYATGPYNRATEAQRQPGSVFKPFVYLAAFQQLHREEGGYWTPAAIVEDAPLDIPEVEEEEGVDEWPRNWDGEYLGPLTVRRALELSRNGASAAVCTAVGPDKVAQAARDCGITSPLNEFPSIALGASEVNLLEVTAAYGTFATGGTGRTPHLVRGILAPSGETVPLQEIVDPPGVGEAEAYLITRILEGAVDHGTGQPARRLGVQGNVAGKTGTTNDFRDAWFVGFSTDRVVGTWVGFDRGEVTGLSGAAAALPIWAEVMKRIRVPDRDPLLERPEEITIVAICPDSGLLATGECPVFLQEGFIEGTEPHEECDRHRPGILGKIKKLLRI
ncbi:MAG: transpeptidase-transglycosylase [Candidatus Eisenbacteria bacterium]|nr:transpeptidase-transglycosylase [Candidatus Latescibacterota bacterium]MBD3302548.1 transpeptidase-transglycosylase [Candidatus Eisenbacteria bacterium]